MGRPFSDSKLIWAANCIEHYVPLYFQPWWMDCVCGAANWDVCLSLDGRGKVEGALVFHLKRRYGLQVVTSPPLTTYSGLWLRSRAGKTKPSSRMAFEKRICEKVLSQLPSHVFFYQQWHPDITNWLPYFWKGFKQTSLYTYRIPLKQKESNLFEGMNKSARKRIREASSNFYINTSEKADIVYRLYELSLQRQGLKPKFSISFLNKVDDILAKRGQRKILLAMGENHRVAAAQYIIWDGQTTYATFGGINPLNRQTGVGHLLFWEALSQNYGNSIIFDFEGSTLEHVEEFLRSFGGTLTPHFKITKAANKWLEAIYQLKIG